MRDLPAPVYVSSVRARGLRPRRGGTTLAMTTCSVLPSVPYDAVGPPNSIFLSRLNTQPTRCPVNASPLPSRTATHDSGPTWFATPWLGGTCTRETYRFVPAHRRVKKLMRLPDSSVGGVRRVVPDSERALPLGSSFRWPGTTTNCPSLGDFVRGAARNRPLLRIGHDRFMLGLKQLVDTVRQASERETRLFIQVIDFLSIRRRPLKGNRFTWTRSNESIWHFKWTLRREVV